jgi:hypothetical protein
MVLGGWFLVRLKTAIVSLVYAQSEILQKEVGLAPQLRTAALAGIWSNVLVVERNERVAPYIGEQKLPRGLACTNFLDLLQPTYTAETWIRS